jgi:hypothetical protein
MANKALSTLLRGAYVREASKTGMGWRIEFTIAKELTEAIHSDKLILEEACDERVRRGGKSGWSSGEIEIQRLMSLVPGCGITSIATDMLGCLQIQFDDLFELKLVPAEFSLDWQWKIAPVEIEAAAETSVVSVHGERVWTRYPKSLARYLE